MIVLLGTFDNDMKSLGQIKLVWLLFQCTIIDIDGVDYLNNTVDFRWKTCKKIDIVHEHMVTYRMQLL